MTRKILSGIIPAACLLLSAPASAFEPVSPGNLNAEVNGMVVDLSWDWGNAGEALLSTDFEWDSLSHERWEVKSTYDYDINGNWMLLSEEEAGMSVSHSGKCAALMIGTENEEDPKGNHQDEWLIVRPGEGAVYMDFWYFLHPELLEVGAYQDFPDHYYVQISFDNGKSWEELWDGRWDMGRAEGVQQASLFLGDEADEDTLVAFHAVSGDEETLYFFWAIDDVEFFTAEEYARSRASRVAPSEWLNNGGYTFRVYLDDQLVADYLKARHFTDYTTKEEGAHTYRVMAWSEAMDEEFEAASVSVQIDDVSFAAPTNVVASYEQQRDGKYVVQVSWEAPDDDVEPAYYNVLLNGKSIGWVEASDELSLGQSGLYKGAYTFAVEAVYEFPEGTSERVCASVFPGTVATVRNLALAEEDGAVRLDWEAPDTDALEQVTYSVYRGDELLAENLSDLTFLDREPATGRYFYNVHAVYGSEKSLPVGVAYGETVVESLPYEQRFDNGHLPTGWEAELVDPYERVKDMYSWRFDNWFDIDLPEDFGIDGGCATVSGVASGMNSLQTFLVSPEFAIPSDGNPQVFFVKYFYEEKPGPTGPAQLILAVSTDGGANWVDLANLQELPNGECVVSLADYKGKNVKLRWGFLARFSGEVAIDNVKLDDKVSGVGAIAAEDAAFDVFTVSGMSVMAGADKAALDQLPSGIYILRFADGTSTKFIR